MQLSTDPDIKRGRRPERGEWLLYDPSPVQTTPTPRYSRGAVGEALQSFRVETMNDKEKLRAWFDDLERQQFYGSVACKFENGRVTYVRMEQGFKPQDLNIQSENPRNHARSNQQQ